MIRAPIPALMALVTAFSLLTGSPASRAQSFRYDGESVKTASYWAALSNLANAVMFSGLGRPQIISPYERDDSLRRAGYVRRPPMPEFPMVGIVYAAGNPKFAAGKPDFGNPRTLVWDRKTFDRTLDPGAHAWALIKITSPEFHLQFHDIAESKLAGLMMLPQARTQATAILDQMRTGDGLFAPKKPDGSFSEPRPLDQAAVLWAVSNLILAGTSDRKDYWHAAYRTRTDPDDYLDLLLAARAAIEKLPPVDAGDKAIAIAALGRFALAERNADRRRAALELARLHADALTDAKLASLWDIGLSIYGLMEAGRLFSSHEYRQTASRIFRDILQPLWEERIGFFRPPSESDGTRYDTWTAGALVAGLNSIRWYGSQTEVKRAQQLYPRVFEAIFVTAGMLRASPLRLVAAEYRKQAPAAHFAHPQLPDPVATGVAPVFAGEVAWRDGRWTVTDPMFRTAGAMFLSNMLAIRSDTRSDLFLGDEEVAALQGKPQR